jgi:hypothetical protein
MSQHEPLGGGVPLDTQIQVWFKSKVARIECGGWTSYIKKADGAYERIYGTTIEKHDDVGHGDADQPTMTLGEALQRANADASILGFTFNELGTGKSQESGPLPAPAAPELEVQVEIEPESEPESELEPEPEPELPAEESAEESDLDLDLESVVLFDGGTNPKMKKQAEEGTLGIKGALSRAKARYERISPWHTRVYGCAGILGLSGLVADRFCTGFFKSNDSQMGVPCLCGERSKTLRSKVRLACPFVPWRAVSTGGAGQVVLDGCGDAEEVGPVGIKTKSDTNRLKLISGINEDKQREYLLDCETTGASARTIPSYAGTVGGS